MANALPPSPGTIIEKTPRQPRPKCAISGQELKPSGATKFSMVRPALAERMKLDHPHLMPEDIISAKILGDYRVRYVEEMLRKERGEISDVERQVIDSLRDHEIAAEDIEERIEDERTFGQVLSDQVAAFGGSWTFIILFGAVVLIWMAFNIMAVGTLRFDVYPFILLNLLLSCVAALQAPVIMMSQRRTEAKDRLRSQNDYRVNLKAELEIRHLHEKVDHLLNRQWERLAELQQIQIEMLQELGQKGKKRPGP